jgi:hypothetical protein
MPKFFSFITLITGEFENKGARVVLSNCFYLVMLRLYSAETKFTFFIVSHYFLITLSVVQTVLC